MGAMYYLREREITYIVEDRTHGRVSIALR